MRLNCATTVREWLLVFPANFPPAYLRHPSCYVVNVGTTWPRMGSPIVKLPMRRTFEKSFLQSHNCRLHLWAVFSAWHHGEDRRKAFLKTVSSLVIFSASFSCQDEQNESLTQNESLSPASPCIGSMPVSVVSKPVSICLRVQCGWEAWENRQIYVYVQWAKATANTIFAQHNWLGFHLLAVSRLIYPA